MTIKKMWRGWGAGVGDELPHATASMASSANPLIYDEVTESGYAPA